MPDIKDVKVINVHAHLSKMRDGTFTDADLEKRIEHYVRPWVIRTWLFGTLDGVIRAQELAPKHICALPWMKLGEVRLDDFKRARDRGAKGFMFGVVANRLPYDDHTLWPIYETIQSWKMPAVFLTGYLSTGMFEPDVNCMGMHPFTLDTICRNFPELNVIGACFGQPWCEDACLLAWKHPNLYWDLTGGTVRLKPASWWKRLTTTSVESELRSHEEKVDMNIVRKFIWATDNPKPEVFRTFYDNLMKLLNVPIEIVEDIYWRNAAKMLGMKESDF